MQVLNKNRLTGVKKPFRLEEIWRIRTRLEIEGNLMQLALLNLAIDSKLRASDLLNLHVYDVSSQGSIFERVHCVQQKTKTSVHHELNKALATGLSQVILNLKVFYFLVVGTRTNPLAIRIIEL